MTGWVTITDVPVWMCEQLIAAKVVPMSEKRNVPPVEVRHKGYYSIDLSTRSWIHLPRFFNSRRAPPLLTPSLVLFTEQSD
jgi:hypothetical protein